MKTLIFLPPYAAQSSDGPGHIYTKMPIIQIGCPAVLEFFGFGVLFLFFGFGVFFFCQTQDKATAKNIEKFICLLLSGSALSNLLGFKQSFWEELKLPNHAQFSGPVCFGVHRFLLCSSTTWQADHRGPSIGMWQGEGSVVPALGKWKVSQQCRLSGLHL